PAARFDLSHGQRAPALLSDARAGGLRRDVRGGDSLGPARDWIRHREGAGDGSADAASVQGVDDDEQFHDRRYGRRERRCLSASRLHRSGARLSGHARRAGWRAGRRAHSDAGQGGLAPQSVHRDRRGDGGADAVQGLHGGRMTEPHGGVSDEEVEQIIGRLLQLGVLVAALVVLVGAALLLGRHGGAVASYAVFHTEPAALRSIAGIVQVGLLLLILTPIVRVAFTLVAFVLQRDGTYIVVTAIVLALLLFGLVFGGA